MLLFKKAQGRGKPQPCKLLLLLFVPPNGADVNWFGPQTVTGVAVANADMGIRRVGLGSHARRGFNFTEVVKWSLAGAIDLPQVGEV